MGALSICPACKRLSLRDDGVCLNPAHGGASRPHTGQPAGSTSPAQIQAVSIAASPAAPPPARSPESQSRPSPQRDSGDDRVGWFNLKNVLLAAGAVAVFMAILFGSAQASSIFRGDDEPAPSVAAPEGQAAMARPESCSASSLWGMRRAPDGNSYWSCNALDGSAVRFYGLTLATLGAKNSTETIRCQGGGKEQGQDYVDCVRVAQAGRR